MKSTSHPKIVSGPVILLNDGTYFDFINPDLTPVSIGAIAHGLSNLCRFNGHTNKFYSVAQHSVLMSFHVEKGFEYEALMHDAVEALIGDVTQPLKALLPDYQVIEERVAEYLAEQFDFTVPTPAEVKTADMRMLLTEKTQLLNTSDVWAATDSYEPYVLKISQWIPSYAKLMFLKRYEQLRT